jgi:enoyl-CoA hydratase
VSEELLVEARGAIRIVTLNRPDALNATNAALHGALARVWPELDADDDVAAIVVTGAGSAFSAGGDLGLLDAMVNHNALRAADKPEADQLVRAMT